jgi:hypothetical protein
VQDTTAPVLTAPNMTVEATSPGGWAGTYAASATDAGGLVTYTFSIPAGTVLPFGTTTVTVTAADGHGNSSSKTFTVTVQDKTAPTVVAPNITMEATGSTGRAVTFAPTITDAGGLASVVYSIPSGSVFAIGTTTVKITATDLHGNVTIKTFTVTVVDTTPPSFTFVSPDVTVTTTSWSGRVVTYLPATATDLTGPVTITYSKASGSTFAVGTTVVTVTATDKYGNKTTTTFKVIVVKV